MTLLPRHWEWLATQPGGASVVLRKLVEDAKRQGSAKDAKRRALESAYRFLHAIGGNFANFEEASRALFAGDAVKFAAETQSWPAAIKTHARKLLGPVF